MSKTIRMCKKRRKFTKLAKPVGAVIGLICLVHLSKNMNKNRGKWLLVNHALEV